VINWLVKEKGLSQDGIAETLEVTPGFISRVRSGERHLTVEHLVALENALRIPMGAILMAANPGNSADAKMRKLQDLVRKALVAADDARASLRSRGGKASKSS
jgi:transcriptional regulator with XRE-family HTH domain